MPRGKNYVNNNRGVSLQASSKSKVSMKLCEYGAGCTRPDCIYRHEGSAKRDEVCLPFLAGKCTFADTGCRKRHPSKDEQARLLAKYKRTNCRFGDECFTEGCLYMHPREREAPEPNYIEPHNVAFPPLTGSSTPSLPKPVANSAWKAAPVVTPTKQQAPPPAKQPSTMQPAAPAWHPDGYMGVDQPYYMSTPYFDPATHAAMEYYGEPQGVPQPVHFNVNAKEFIPGGTTV